ncbi:MAG: iron-containing alcohol dehydrogenase [Deltaproteobacteria bacterium]|nr:iron-containing alcohol dehydrogenase [Deltaproteobacteria bacterium]
MRYGSDLSFVFSSPTRLVFGAGQVSEAGMEAERIGITRALLVSDRVLAERTDLVGRVSKALGSRLAATFVDVPPDSGVDAVMAGYAAAREAGADGVVSVGGGSVIDTAKGIAILVREGGHLRDFEGFQLLTRRAASHVVVPTTAGTGSEVTYVAVIKDHQAKRKLLFGDYNILPDVAILDPEMTLALPGPLTAATGMDALSHALEAMHSLQREPVADALALHAIRIVREALPACVSTPGDVAARGRQLLASTMAGAAFSNAQVGLVHAMSHTAGAHFGVHHGLANSICMPHVVRFNAEECGEVYREVATAFGVPADGDDAAVADRLAGALEAFARSLGLPTRLADVKVPRDALPALAEATLFDGSLVYNAKPVSDAAGILPVWEAAWGA